jgi:hypothetical protein
MAKMMTKDIAPTDANKLMEMFALGDKWEKSMPDANAIFVKSWERGTSP